MWWTKMGSKLARVYRMGKALTKETRWKSTGARKVVTCRWNRRMGKLATQGVTTVQEKGSPLAPT
jgi:hypothetical protein